LPSVAAPPAKPTSSAQVNTPMFPPPVSKSKPPPVAAAAATPSPGAKLDMDWDDDEEATHVFDKDRDGSQADAAPSPPTNRGVQPPISKPLPPPVKQTLLGVMAPPPPPPSINPPHAGLPPPPQTLRPGGVPPPPQSVGSNFARSSSINASSPGPAGYPPPPPMDRPPQSLPLPPQQSTAPMAMPGRSSTAPAVPPPSAAASYRPPPPDIAPLPVPMPLPNRMEATALVRPPEPNRGLLYAGLVGGFLTVVAVVFYMWPHTGQIAVNVADAKGAPIPHLQIFIDGKKQCESAPCIVSDEATGSHTVKVEASGYDPTVDKAVVVESKKDMTVDFTLTPTAAAATGVKVQGTQGAKLYIDDKEMGALPLELKDLQPGSHKVKIAAGDRYTAVEKTVTIANNEMQDLGSVSLKVIKGKVTVTLGTPGAKVFLVSGGDRREILQMPISLEIPDAATKTWTLVASKPGFNDYNQPVNFDDGQAEKAFTVTLDPKGAAAPPAVAWTPPATTYHPPPATANPTPPSAPAKEKEAPAASEPASGSGGGQAFLNINSIPASSVILDGKPIGQTPKLKFPVSPGSHSVLFVNADQGFKKQISVSVGAGETKPAIGKN
jgi:PEGA domain-containing protein